jgi:glycosyltransferase involved in cell wall biosynthesis
MIAHAYYDEDPRVRREAEALVAAGWPVEVFALRRPTDEAEGELRGVRIHRLPARRHQGARLGVYLAEYVAFFLRAAMAVTAAHRRRRLALVHVHTIPDGLVFAALPVKLAGVPVLLDFHEAMPEFFASRFPRAANAAVMAAMRLQERLAAAFADGVITVNRALAERLVRRGVWSSKITVIHNGPSAELFDAAARPVRRFMEDGTLRLIYAGALTPNYELDVLLQALGQLRRKRPELPLRVDVYGRGDSEPALHRLSGELGSNEIVHFHGRIPLEDVAAAIAASDIGLAPVRRNAQTELSLPGKILEYLRMGKPVVASDLATVTATFGPTGLSMYRGGDPSDLAAAILRIVDDPAAAARSAAVAKSRQAELGWDHEAVLYVALVERLVHGRTPVA